MNVTHDPLLGFDPMAQDPSRNTGGSRGLPPSDSKGHLVVITGHEMKQFVKNPEDGNRIVFSLLVVGEGPFKGKTGTHSENIGHVIEQNREIAAAKVTAICRCVGLRTAIQNPQVDLYNKPFRMVFDYQDGHDAGPRTATNKGYTECKKIFDANGLEPDDPNAGLGGGGVATGVAVPGAGIAPTQMSPAQLAQMQANMAAANPVGGQLPQGTAATPGTGQALPDPAGISPQLQAQQQALAAQQQQIALQAQQAAQIATSAGQITQPDPTQAAQMAALQAQMAAQQNAGSVAADPAAGVAMPGFMS